MWSSPIYRFRVPKNAEGESDQLKELVIDVTGSAPVFPGPSDALIEVLQDIFESDSLSRIDTVLEFGAGKLKNIPYLLKQGKVVFSVSAISKYPPMTYQWQKRKLKDKLLAENSSRAQLAALQLELSRVMQEE